MMDIDLVPVYLSSLEKEIINVFIDKISNITPALIEKEIQLAYIFNFAENYALRFSLEDIKAITDEAKVNPLLNSFLTDFREYTRTEDPQKKKEMADKIMKTYFTGEGRLSAEKKRHILVRAINKISPNTIPSYMKINHILNILEAKGYIQHTVINKKKIWEIAPGFYQAWLNRRNQIINEFKQKEAETKTEEAEAYLINKYDSTVLSFLRILYQAKDFLKSAPLVIRESHYIKELIPPTSQIR